MPKGVYKRDYNKIYTIERNKKISEFRKGIKFTKKHKENISKTLKSIKCNVGKKHPNWQGGISNNPYPINWTETLRRSIRERDKYICQLCSKQQGDRAHSIHHIDYNKQNCNPNNLITLCVGCNTKVNTNRDYWTNYFKNLLNQDASNNKNI